MKKSHLSFVVMALFLLALCLCPGAVAEATHEAKIGDAPYARLQDALEAATDGDRVTMLMNVEPRAALTVKNGVTLDVDGYMLENDSYILKVEKGGKIVLGLGGAVDMREVIVEGEILGANAYVKHNYVAEGWFNSLIGAIVKPGGGGTIFMLSDASLGGKTGDYGAFIPSGTTLDVGNFTLTTNDRFSVEDRAGVNVGVKGKLIIESGRFSAIKNSKMTVDGALINNGYFYTDGDVKINGSFQMSKSAEISFTELFKMRIGYDPSEIEWVSSYGGMSYRAVTPKSGLEYRYVTYGKEVALKARAQDFESWEISSDCELINGTKITDKVIEFQARSAYDITLKTKAPAEPLTVAPETLVLKVGKTAALTASEEGVTWSSSDESVATVGAGGIVTAVAKGDVVVAAGTVDGRSATCAVKVTEPEPDPEVLDIGIKALAVVGGKEMILPIFKGVSGTWSAEDPAIAKIVAQGRRLKAVGTGETKIIFTVDAKAKAALTLKDRDLLAGGRYEIKLSVCKKGELATAVFLNVKKLKLETVGTAQTAQLTATVKPAKALDQSVFFTSTNPAVATVDENGLVTAVGEGQCKVIAASASLRQKAVAVTVTGAIAVKPKKQTIKAGKTAQLKVAVNRALEDQSVTWASDDAAVATVDAAGVVTAVAKGKATITATASNGEMARCVVTVKK